MDHWMCQYWNKRLEGNNGAKGGRGVQWSKLFEKVNGTKRANGAKGTNGEKGSNGTNGTYEKWDQIVKGLKGAKETNAIGQKRPRQWAKGKNREKETNGTKGTIGANGTYGAKETNGQWGKRDQWGRRDRWSKRRPTGQTGQMGSMRYEWSRGDLCIVWDTSSSCWKVGESPRHSMFALQYLHYLLFLLIPSYGYGPMAPYGLQYIAPSNSSASTLHQKFHS